MYRVLLLASHAHFGFSYVILINAYVVNHYTCRNYSYAIDPVSPTRDRPSQTGSGSSRQCAPSTKTDTSCHKKIKVKNESNRNDGEHDRRRRPRHPAPPPVRGGGQPCSIAVRCIYGGLPGFGTRIFRSFPLGTSCVILRHEPLGFPSGCVRRGPPTAEAHAPVPSGGDGRHRPPSARGTVRSAPPPFAVPVEYVAC